jgi:YbbR domain-containing protein
VAVQQQATVQIEGLNKKPLAEVSSSPTQVSATVPINNNKLQRNLSISIITTGQVAAGFHVVGIDATPPIVLVEGDPTVFSGVSAVDTDPIDLAGMTGDINRTVNLRPKAGVTVLTKGPFNVKIKIQQDPRVEPSPSPPAAPSPNPSPSPTR